MCPYLILKESDPFCEGTSSGKVFSPRQKRQKEYCLGSFTQCVFYQLKTGWVTELEGSMSHNRVL
ncbi:MAG TPA: hypothetical protein PLT76_02675 [Candidatus Omnitrophota bacterium]|nr:hypothetical protein [Candidatus Omnitrophota bacterium]